MEARRVLVGIGNPGADYENTRHNVGFMVLDRAAERLDLEWSRLDRRALGLSGKAKARVAWTTVEQEPVLLVKPLTYVNLSGDVVGPLLRVLEVPPDALFVVIDDLNLPLGRIRIRPAGSSGGHNGLRSIEAALATNEYPRLRLGIGQGDDSATVEHVLGPFVPEEQDVVRPALAHATDAVVAWLGGTSLQDLMSRYNGSSGGDLEPNL